MQLGSPDSNRFTLVIPKSENGTRLQAALASQHPTVLPMAAISMSCEAVKFLVSD